MVRDAIGRSAKQRRSTVCMAIDYCQMWTVQWFVRCAFNGSVHWFIPLRNIQNAIRMTDVCEFWQVHALIIMTTSMVIVLEDYIQAILADCLQHLKILSTLGDVNCNCPIYLHGINSTTILIASDKEFRLTDSKIQLTYQPRTGRRGYSILIV